MSARSAPASAARPAHTPPRSVPLPYMASGEARVPALLPLTNGCSTPLPHSSSSSIEDDKAMCHAHLGVLCAIAAHKHVHVRRIFLRHHVMKELAEELNLEYHAHKHARFPQCNGPAHPPPSPDVFDVSPPSPAAPASAKSQASGGGRLVGPRVDLGAVGSHPADSTGVALNLSGDMQEAMPMPGGTAYPAGTVPQSVGSSGGVVYPAASTVAPPMVSNCGTGIGSFPRSTERAMSSPPKAPPVARLPDGRSACTSHPVSSLSSEAPSVATSLATGEVPSFTADSNGTAYVPPAKGCAPTRRRNLAEQLALVGSGGSSRMLDFGSRAAATLTSTNPLLPTFSGASVGTSRERSAATSHSSAGDATTFRDGFAAASGEQLRWPLQPKSQAQILLTSPAEMRDSAFHARAYLATGGAKDCGEEGARRPRAHGGARPMSLKHKSQEQVPALDSEAMARARCPLPNVGDPAACSTVRQPRFDPGDTRAAGAIDPRSKEPPERSRRARQNLLLATPQLEVLSACLGTPSLTESKGFTPKTPGSGAEIRGTMAHMQRATDVASAGDCLHAPGTGKVSHRVDLDSFPRQPARTSIQSLRLSSERPELSSMQSSTQSVGGVATPAAHLHSLQQQQAVPANFDHHPWVVSRRRRRDSAAALELVGDLSTGSQCLQHRLSHASQPVAEGGPRSDGGCSASSEGFSGMPRISTAYVTHPTAFEVGQPVSEGHEAAERDDVPGPLVSGHRRYSSGASPPPSPALPSSRHHFIRSLNHAPGGQGRAMRPYLGQPLQDTDQSPAGHRGMSPSSPLSFRSSGSIHPYHAYDEFGAPEAMLAPNNVFDSALHCAMAGNTGVCAVLLPTNEPPTADGTVYSVEFGGVTRHVVLTGDMDDDIDIIADLEDELGVPVSVHGIVPDPVSSVGNPVTSDDSDSEPLAAGVSRSRDMSHSREVGHSPPSVLSRQERREAAGGLRSNAGSCAGASAASAYLFQHSTESVNAPNASSLPWPICGPDLPSNQTSPSASAVLRPAVSSVPKLALTSFDFVGLRATAEAEGEALQDESLYLATPGVQQTSTPGRLAADGLTTASQHGPLSLFEDCTIHAQRGANFKSQTAFLQHIKRQEAEALTREQAQSVAALRVKAQGGEQDAGRAFDYDAESGARLIYRSPSLHIALLTLMLQLLLTDVRPDLPCLVSDAVPISALQGLPMAASAPLV
jgi:hypothetical protein